jgi:hypothetical protein
MSATTRIYVELVVALVIYILGSAVLLQDVGGGAPRTAESSFLGPDEAGLGRVDV